MPQSPARAEELRDKVAEEVHYLTDDSDILSSGIRGAIDRLTAIAEQHAKAELTSLLASKQDMLVEVTGKPYTTEGGGLTNIHYERKTAVPVSVIQEAITAYEVKK